MFIDVIIIGSTAPDLEAMARAAGIRAASAGASELLKLAQPTAKAANVVVVDLRGRGSIPPALALLKKEHPSTGIVIVATRLAPALMLEAMRAGVSELVSEPVTQGDLADAIARVAGKGGPFSTSEVFAMLGAKGGVGTTTLAVNVATTLASRASGQVLLIDMHPAGGDAAIFLGAEPRFTMLDALENAQRLDETYLKGLVTKTNAGPDSLASPDRIVAGAADAPRVRAVVEAAMRCYRYVVLDVPRSETSVADALELASNITVVATQDLAALHSATRLTIFLRQRYGAERVRAVVNRFDRTAEIGREDLERALGGPVYGSFPDIPRLAVDALNKGLPIVVENHNRLASAFAGYARSLVTESGPQSAAGRSGGLFGISSASR